MDKRPIGVFDSGVGGLSCVKALMQLLPNEDIVYLGDTGRVPYGTRDRETIVEFTRGDVNFLLRHDVKMLIAACGTICSVIPDDLVQQMGVPFIDVITPAAEEACRLSKSGSIGVIATNATVNSGSFVKAISGCRPEATVATNACPQLVTLVEQGRIADDDEVTRPVAAEYLVPIVSENVDTLILGCTHFPLLYGMFDSLLEQKVALVDAGRAAAQRAKDHLTAHGLLKEDGVPGKRQYFVTGSTDGFSAVAERFTGVPAEATFMDYNSL